MNVLTEKQDLVLRQRDATIMRRLGITKGEYEPHKLDWRTLNSHQKEIRKAATALLDNLKDNTPTEEIRAVEQAHDAAMEIYDAIDREKDIRSEINNREPRTEESDPRRPMPGDAEARGVDGEDDLETRDVEPTETVALRSKETMVDYIARTSRKAAEYRGLSVGRYLRAMVTGPKGDIEKRALAEGTDSAGGFTVPDVLSARLIDKMRAASVVFRAGAQTVPLTSDISYIARVETDPIPAWRVENDTVNVSDPTFGRVTFTARTLAVLVKASRELLEDSLNLETALPDLLATALAQELDRVAILGSGTPPEPRGVANFTGLTSNSFAGGALAGYGPLIQARTALRGVNSDVTAYVLSPRDEGILAGLTATDGQPINIPPAISRVPMLTTSKIPTNLGSGTNESMILAGDWSKLMVGVRASIRVEVLRERYADNYQYGFLAAMRADVAAENNAAFTKLTGILEAAPEEP